MFFAECPSGGGACIRGSRAVLCLGIWNLVSSCYCECEPSRGLGFLDALLAGLPEMVAATWVPVSSNTLAISRLLPKRSDFRNGGPCLPRQPSRGFAPVRASSDGSDKDQPSSSKENNPVAAVLSIPRTIWGRILNPLSDFGFGRRSIWEGGVGLFIASGTVLMALTLVWLRGFHLRSRFRKYQVVFEFAQACGICLGTPVRIRGVTVGTVVRVHSSLKSVDAVVEVRTHFLLFFAVETFT